MNSRAAKKAWVGSCVSPNTKGHEYEKIGVLGLTKVAVGPVVGDLTHWTIHSKSQPVHWVTSLAPF